MNVKESLLRLTLLVIAVLIIMLKLEPLEPCLTRLTPTNVSNLGCFKDIQTQKASHQTTTNKTEETN